MTPGSHAGAWSVIQRGFELRMLFGGADSRAQHAALHLDSSYLRLCPSPDSGWGTSAILLPAFWTRGQLLQGAAVAVSWAAKGKDLLLEARGRVALLDVDLEVGITQPTDGRLSARVGARARGEVRPDQREGEAFRMVTLSSMRIDDRHWDARSAYADDRALSLDRPGWIVDARSGLHASRFGLVGGTSEWKRNAPTVEVALDRPRVVGGWLSRSSDPNGDNVSLWCATRTVQDAWSYTIHARRAA